MFGGAFGGFGGQGRRQRDEGPRRTPDVTFQLGLSLRDFYCGRKKKLKIQRKVLCTGCGGKGSKKEGALQSCKACNGQGVRMVIQRLGPSMIQQMQTTCDECGGKGEIINPKDACPDCKGKKVQPESKILEVYVRPGMQPGERITFYGDADEAYGQEPGDVIVVLTPLREEDNDEAEPEMKSAGFNRNNSPSKKRSDRTLRPKFQRLKNGVDLVLERKISLQEALLGFKFAIRHLDDRIIIVESPPRYVAENDAILLVESAGMPNKSHSSRTHGDLFVKLQVVMPTYDQIQSLGAGKTKMIRELLPPPLNQLAPDTETKEHTETTDPLTGDPIIIPAPETIAAKPYDADLARMKQQQAHEEARNAMDEDDEGGAGGQNAQCRQM